MRRWLAGLLGNRQDQPKDPLPKVKIGLCAMDKKVSSKPMQQILIRLLAFNEFQIEAFGDDVILNAPVEEWPRCDCLLTWHSEGFPLSKVQYYARLRKPFLVNDVHMQNVLLDRRQVYKVLEENGIPVPTHIVVDRDDGKDPEGFVEDHDYVEMDGRRIYKPFVEKPASGEDHNIYIYYPHSMGGGVKRLFRKVDNKSSQYDPDHPGTVRRDGTYMYEEFLATGGTDVKVYTVGPRYAHAEARKSPVVDGKVLRTSDGKEMRFPVLLTPQEKEIARMVTLAFGQKVCGFDLLRSEKGISYVCDVNGWSFVKNSKKYYDDGAGILRSIIIGALAPHRLALQPNLPLAGVPSLGLSVMDEEGRKSVGIKLEEVEALQLEQLEEEERQQLEAELAAMYAVDEQEAQDNEDRSQREELRCLLAVIRHGDRTPKQKLKMSTTSPLVLELFEKWKDSKGKQAKLKSPVQLQELLDVTRKLITLLDEKSKDTVAGAAAMAASEAAAAAVAEVQQKEAVAALAAEGGDVEGGEGEVAAAPPPPPLIPDDPEAAKELREKLRVVLTVLEQGGHFSGVNRKVQLKPIRWANHPHKQATSSLSTALSDAQGVFSGTMSGPTSGTLPLSAPLSAPLPSAHHGPVQEVLMILKWGGVLTHAGRQQAEDLGRVFRLVMYPNAGGAGGGLLRLHSTYRHDFKIYSSDEGRVQTSAAAFTKGLLDLEGNSLTPILVSLVKKDASMLDAFAKGASHDMKDAKNRLYSLMMERSPAAANAGLSPSGSIANNPGSTPPSAPPSLPPSLGPSIHASPFASPMPSNPNLQAMEARAAAEARIAAENSESNSNSERPSLLAISTMIHDQQGASNPNMGAMGEARSGRASGSVSPRPPPSPQPLSALARRTSLEGISRPHFSDQTAAATSSDAQDKSPLGGEGLSCPTDMTDCLKRLPSNCDEMMREMVVLMKALVDDLRRMCIQESSDTVKPKRYSSLSQDPKEWRLLEDKPCGGEKMLLMFDRWQKLTKSFYSEKKDKFDLSKIPDIYDSVKYDAIHNLHLPVQQHLQPLYVRARMLADLVIPNEYGTCPAGKLQIGAKIAYELLGKILADLESMREESVATASLTELAGQEAVQRDEVDDIPGRTHGLTGGSSEGGHLDADDYDAVENAEHETIHRLCPTYASDINSPLRHVRTRIYFTSESHMHSLVNVMRYCHLARLHEEDKEGQEQRRGASSGGGAPTGGTSDFNANSAANSVASGSRVGTPVSPTTLNASTGSMDHGSMAAAAAAVPKDVLHSMGSFTSAQGVDQESSNLTSPFAALSFHQSTLMDAPASVAEGSNSGWGTPACGLLCQEAQEMLDQMPELDYLTHVVFRMYENKAVPVHAPGRFRVEMLFSPGAAYDPFQLPPQMEAKGHKHTIPVVPRKHLHAGDGATLDRMKQLLRPYAATTKFMPCSYALAHTYKAQSMLGHRTSNNINRLAAAAVLAASGHSMSQMGTLGSLNVVKTGVKPGRGESSPATIHEHQDGDGQEV